MTGARVAGSRRRAWLGSAALVASAALVVSGCTSDGADPTEDGPSEDQGGQTTIRLTMQNANVQAEDPSTWQLVQAFEAANPDIKVELGGQAVEQHLQSMVIAAQSGTLPEIFWVYDSIAREMAAEGATLDLGPLVDELGLGDRLAESKLTAFNDGAVQYGLPYQGLITGFYYNSEILAEHGIDVPETIEDLIAASETLSAAGVTPIAKGANGTSFSVWAFLGMLSRFGFEDRYEAILEGGDSYDNPDFLRFYEWVDRLRGAGAFPTNVSTQDYFQAVDSFVTGNAAMLDSGVWQASEIEESAVRDVVGFWAGPTFPDGVGPQELLINVPSAPFAVGRQVGEDPALYDAVKRFFEFYYSDEGQEILVANGQPPVTLFDPDVDAGERPVFAAVLEEASRPGWSSPEAQPDLVVSSAVSNAMYDSIFGVIQGVLTPQEAVSLVQSAIDAE